MKWEARCPLHDSEALGVVLVEFGHFDNCGVVKVLKNVIFCDAGVTRFIKSELIDFHR